MSELSHHKKNRILLDLRLWSSTTPLISLAEELNIPISYSHISGEPMADSGPLSEKRARRFYISTANSEVETDEEVRKWLDELLFKLDSSRLVSDLLQNHIITASFNIFIAGETIRAFPYISNISIMKSKNIGVSIYAENYTKLKNGLPVTRWIYRRRQIESQDP